MIERVGGPAAAAQWKQLEKGMRPLQKGAALFPAAAIRSVPLKVHALCAASSSRNAGSTADCMPLLQHIELGYRPPCFMQCVGNTMPLLYPGLLLQV
jgi:hypothetical protein